VFVWSDEKYQEVVRLFGAGGSDYDIARITGVPRSTVQKWRNGISNRRTRHPDHSGWRPTDAHAYCYALGLYLGDGHIVLRNERPSFFRLFLDAQYTSLIDEAAAAYATVFGVPVYRYDWGEANRIILQISHPALLAAFPQHGPGRKHLRPIVLTDWQLELTHAHPGALVRGLIHSDGCRTVNRFKTQLPSGRVAEYAYPRYFFSNLSGDILEIFREHCALLGVRCTLSNPRNLSVSDKKSIAILDEVVGPKS
jgi:hypothetical protein